MLCLNTVEPGYNRIQDSTKIASYIDVSLVKSFKYFAKNHLISHTYLDFNNNNLVY